MIGHVQSFNRLSSRPMRLEKLGPLRSSLLLAPLFLLPLLSNASSCVEPGSCTPPASDYSRVIDGPKPGQQWNINGGFCGAWSIQQSAKAFGAWVSQDLVRKANRDQSIPHFMHGDAALGYEVVPSNQAYTAEKLKLTFDEFDYTQPAPQAAAWKAFVKGHLVRGEPVVMMPLCKGDPHRCYPLSCPGGGKVDHVEPIFGIFSNHSLDDPTVYDDDVILHASDQDLEPYYREMRTLEDTAAMEGNCADAQPGFGKNEMYPCVDQNVTYGMAITGLNISSSSSSSSSNSVSFLPVSLDVSGLTGEYEPDVRTGEAPVALTATLSIGPGVADEDVVTLYRYGSTADLPGDDSDLAATAEKVATLKGADADADGVLTFTDVDTFQSDSAAYFVAVKN